MGIFSPKQGDKVPAKCKKAGNHEWVKTHDGQETMGKRNFWGDFTRGRGSFAVSKCQHCNLMKKTFSATGEEEVHEWRGLTGRADLATVGCYDKQINLSDEDFDSIMKDMVAAVTPPAPLPIEEAQIKSDGLGRTFL